MNTNRNLIGWILWSCSLGMVASAQQVQTEAADSAAVVQRDSVVRTEKVDSALNEVVIKGKLMEKKADHILLYMTDENRKFGTNALDAVSTLNLFTTSLNETTLQSYDRQEVFILINGVPSTGIDLRSYKAKDIKSVEYYPIAPARYMSMTQGPVANIIVKKRHDILFSTYVNTGNALTHANGNNQISQTYADSLNRVNITYFGSYFNTDKITDQSVYTLKEPYFNSAYDSETKRMFGSHQIQGSYQYYNKNDLFNAQVAYTTSPSHDYSLGHELLTHNESNEWSESADSVSIQAQSVSLNLYYHHLIKGNIPLSFNVVNTYSWNDNNQQFRRTYPDFPDRNSYLTNFSDNKVYALIANSAVSYTFKNNSNIDFGVKYGYTDQRQNVPLQQSAYASQLHQEKISASFNKFWHEKNKPYYSLLVMASADLQQFKSPSYTHSTVVPNFHVSADYWAERLKGFTIQFVGKVYAQSPALADRTEIISYMKPNFAYKGNPMLQNEWKGFYKLNFMYLPPQSQNKIALHFTTSHGIRTNKPMLFTEGSMAYMQLKQLKNQLHQFIGLDGTWNFTKWLRFYYYLEYYFNRYDTPSRRVRNHYMRYGGMVVCNNEHWDFLVAANSPTKTYNGDLTDKGSEQFCVECQYKGKNWSLGARWNYSSYLSRYGYNPNFAYKENKDFKKSKYLFSITATWSFSKGRERRKDRERLYNNSTDNGISTYGRPLGM